MSISHIHSNRILVVDTSTTALELMIRLSEKANCRMMPALDGREACQILKGDSNFSGAIFNLVLPYLDAPELIRFMKSEKRLMQIPIMVMTEREDFGLIAEAQKAGACALLQKPFSPGQFKALMSLLSNKSYRPRPTSLSRTAPLREVQVRSSSLSIGG